MPRFRYLTPVSQTTMVSIYSDPRTSRAVLVDTAEDSTPTTVTVTTTPLTPLTPSPGLWSFVGNVDGALWQIDVIGTGEMRSVRATTAT